MRVRACMHAACQLACYSLVGCAEHVLPRLWLPVAVDVDVVLVEVGRQDTGSRDGFGWGFRVA